MLKNVFVSDLWLQLQRSYELFSNAEFSQFFPISEVQIGKNKLIVPLFVSLKNKPRMRYWVSAIKICSTIT